MGLLICNRSAVAKATKEEAAIATEAMNFMVGIMCVFEERVRERERQESRVKEKCEM